VKHFKSVEYRPISVCFGLSLKSCFVLCRHPGSGNTTACVQPYPVETADQCFWHRLATINCRTKTFGLENMQTFTFVWPWRR